MTFQVGDVVRLSDYAKRCYYPTPANPHSGVGVVKNLKDKRVHVYWNTHRTNFYDHCDLSLVGDLKEILLESYL